MTIERRFDVPFVANLARREKQIQQNYRPIIAVHKWFARRPGTLFRALLLSEFSDGPLRETFYRTSDQRGKKVGDPFMGGGTPLLEANRIGCDVVGFDINPMAWWIVRQELASLDAEQYQAAAVDLVSELRKTIGSLYQTRCLSCQQLADVKYWLWVKQAVCPACEASVDLFPGYLVAENVRHPLNVLICASCGELNEVRDRKKPGNCGSCRSELRVEGPARRGACRCRSCGTTVRFPSGDRPLTHRMVAIEYHCHPCRPKHSGRFFKRPDSDDIQRYRAAENKLAAMKTEYVPDDAIPAGDETSRLHRWGYSHYRELFNARQLLALELSAHGVVAAQDQVVREALATNLSDLLRYQNMLCRYDTMALKSLDIFSIHGFPVGLMACESNIFGISNGKGSNVGSGGWLNFVAKYSRAKSYCTSPFEIRHEGLRKVFVPIAGESIGNGDRKVTLNCETSTAALLETGSLDAVLTDPPYFENVQYAELMDFCYVWLRKLIGKEHPAFRGLSTRNAEELTGNETLDRGVQHFTEGLSEVFRRMAKALKPGAPLAFTYHHNQLGAYFPVTVALLDAGLACTASLPCPGEMGASIHIAGTGSSTVDTVFVCRTEGSVQQRVLAKSTDELATLVRTDISSLQEGGLRATPGDIRCVLFGHLVRLVIWNYRKTWNAKLNTAEKLARIERATSAWDPSMILDLVLGENRKRDPVSGPLFQIRDSSLALESNEVPI